jgi:hypothetical protein
LRVSVKARKMNGLTRMIGKAQRECVSDDALKHFRTYKYSSVDKSPISQHILRHYVRCSNSP